MKVYDAASHPERGHRRPRRMRQDTAGLRHALRRRRGQPARQGRRRHDRHRLRRRRNRPQAHPLLQPRLRRVAEDQDQHHRHARLRQLPERRARGAARRRSARWSCVDAVAGVEVQTEKLWAEAAALDLPRIVVVNRLDRERASLERDARVAAPRLRPRDRPDPAARSARRRASPASSTWCAMKALTFAADGSGKMTEGDDPGGAGRRARRSAREQLIEMVAEADEQLMETFFAEGTLTQEQLTPGCARRRWPARSSRCVCTSGLPRDRHPAAARRDRHATCRRRPSATSRVTDAGGETDGVKASDTAPYAAFVWKTIADPFAGRITMLRVVAGHAQVGHDRPQPDARHAERLGHLLVAAGQDADARARAEGRRPRRRRQAEGHAHQRRARRQGDQRQDSRRSRSRSRCSPTPSSRRAAATRTRSARRCTACRKRTRRSATRAIRRPTSCCSPARASCTSRSRSRS